ncbi:MAG: aldolase catalytic domain-containing protein [Phycisphaeraceae bacterium]|nr:aldolase catalytic domain-containing protein [Phycisphaeraceae bacterium]
MSSISSKGSSRAPWITYRPELKVLDCTVRDGGLVNDHQFDESFVKAVYESLVAAGVDYMEIGYKNAKRFFPTDKFGPFRHSDEEAMRRVVGENKTGLKLCAMADAGKSDWKKDILPKKDSVLDCIRVACYVNQIPEAVEMIVDAHEKGYEVWCNIMAISTVNENEIDQALEVLAPLPIATITVVDSFGSLYAEQVEILVKKYKAAMPGKEVGMHAHNNQQLAFANSIEAIIHGANRVDCTIDGLGRGAGNCHTELMLGFLRNPKFKLRPLVEVIQNQFLKLRQELDWGPSIPYIITGQRNLHPRAAMEWRESDKKDRFLEFYDKIVTDI